MNPSLPLALLFSAFLCLPAWSAPQDDPAPSGNFETVKTPTPAYARYQEVFRETRRLRDARDTAGLEALAASLRSEAAILDDSASLISRFYNAAVNVPEEEPAQSEAMAFYEKWAADQPGSITAQICLADALTSYAWNARGSGYANTVSDEGWKLFTDRLARAWDILKTARSLPAKCPGWFSAAQTVALGQGWSRDDYMAMVDQAIADYPAYGEFYTNTCYWLTPRWYGERGDFEKWLALRADSYPPADRDRQYARFVWLADRMPVSGEIVFSPDRLDWDRTRHGFDLWLKDDPGNLLVRSEYARLAVLANDRVTAREQLSLIGPKFLPAMWKKDRFEAVWAYAFDDGVNPLLAAPKKSPRPRLDPGTVEKVRLVLHFSARALGGFLAGLLLLLLAIQRRRVGVGIAAFFASIAIALPLGTAATMLPAVGLWLLLRRQPSPFANVTRAPSGWLTLAGIAGLVIFDFALQIGATTFSVISLKLAQPALHGDDLLASLFSQQDFLLGIINTSWLTALLLLLICLPQSLSSWRARLGLLPAPLIPGIVWTIAGTFLMLLIGFLLDFVADDTSRRAMELLAMCSQHPFLFLLALVIVAPVFEEIVFRGYLISGWLHKIGFWPTLLSSSLIFALCHIQYGWTGLLYIFLLGLALAVIRIRTGSIYPGIALHAVTNLAVCLQVFFFPS